MENVIDRHTHTLLAFAHAERTAEINFFLQSVLGDQVLKLLDYLT